MSDLYTSLSGITLKKSRNIFKNDYFLKKQIFSGSARKKRLYNFKIWKEIFPKVFSFFWFHQNVKKKLYPWRPLSGLEFLKSGRRRNLREAEDMICVFSYILMVLQVPTDSRFYILVADPNHLLFSEPERKTFFW